MERLDNLKDIPLSIYCRSSIFKTAISNLWNTALDVNVASRFRGDCKSIIIRGFKQECCKKNQLYFESYYLPNKTLNLKGF